MSQWVRWPCHPAKPAGNCTQSVCAFLGERVRTPDHTNQASPLRQTSKTIEMNLVVSRGLASPATRPSRQTKTTETTARPTLATRAGEQTIEVNQRLRLSTWHAKSTCLLGRSQNCCLNFPKPTQRNACLVLSSVLSWGRGVNTPPNKSSKAITPSVKTIEVNLAVSCGLASRATRPSRHTKTTQTMARPTLATHPASKP